MNGRSDLRQGAGDLWEPGRPTKRVRIEEPVRDGDTSSDCSPPDYQYPEPPSPPRAYHNYGEIQYEESEDHSDAGSDTDSTALDRTLNDRDDAHFTERLDDDWFESILTTGEDADYTFSNDWNVSDDDDDDDYSDRPSNRGEGRREARGERARGRGRGRGRPRGSRAGSSAARGTAPSRSEPSDRGMRATRKRRAPGSRREAYQRLPRGPRKQPEASPEVAALLQRANAALMSGDFESALNSARDAVHLNPEIYQAHVLTSEALEKLGRSEDAIDALQIAASAYTDPELLKDVARRIEEKNSDFQHDNRLKELYTKIIDRSKNRWDSHARRKRLYINVRKRHVGHSIGDCIEILAHEPLDAEALQILVEIGPKNKDHQRIIDAYNEAFGAARAARAAGDHNSAAKFDLGLVNMYLDLLLDWKQYSRGITTLSQMARWIMGREEDTFWDDVPDDREWDEDDYPRRQEVPSHAPGEHEQSAYDLPIELRIKLGLFRFHLDPPELDEAARHFGFLTPDDRAADAPVHEFPDLFQDVGKAYASLKTEASNREALRFLRPLAEERPPDFDLTEVWSIMAACYMSLHSANKTVKLYLDEAEKAYVEYLQTGPEKSSARIKLIDIYLGQGREYEAQQHVFHVADKKRYLLQKMQAQNLLNPQYVARDDPKHAKPHVEDGAMDTTGASAEESAALNTSADNATGFHADTTVDSTPRINLTRTEALAEAARAREDDDRNVRLNRSAKRPPLKAIAPRPGDVPFDAAQADEASLELGPSEETVAGISHDVPLAARELLGLDGLPRRYGRPKLKVTQRKRRNLLPPELDAAALDRTSGTWTRMCALDERIEEGDAKAEEIWINLGARLIEDFINEERHFPNRDKYKQFTGYGGTGKWYQYDRKTETFQGITFATWCDIFCKLAMLQAKQHTKLRSGQSIPKASGNDEQDDADAADAGDADAGDDPVQERKLLKHQRAIAGYSMMASMRTIAYAANAHPFHHNESQTFRIHATWLACALALQEEEYVQSECRYFAKAYPHQSDTFRLYSIASRLYPTKDRTWYNSGPNQKYLLRQIKAMDYALLPPASRRLFKLSDQERKGIVRNMQAKERHAPEELDPTLLTLYGHIIMAGGILNNALYYYYRALALAPDDPVLHLCIANCYIVQGFKRLTANRTYYMQLGSAFMHRYYEIRTRGRDGDGDAIPVHVQEAEFNMAHLWHLLGLVSLAVPRYERVLELSGEVQREQRERREKQRQERQEQAGDGATAEAEGGEVAVEDFAPEAAFALSTIMALNGAARRARELREKWMTI